jgi:hypothetical protein
MMNLLVGVLSEELAKVLANEVVADYEEMANIILDVEALYFWNWGSSKKPNEHFIYAVEVTEEDLN